MKNFIKYMAIIANMLILTVLGAVIYYNRSLPNNYYVTTGSELKISDLIEAVPCSRTYPKGLSIPAGSSQGNRVELRLLGIIPIKTVNIQEISEPVLIPCGNPFGIKLTTNGVIVVELSSFETDHGIGSPAIDAGIKTGDIIKTINGKKILSNDDIAEIVEKSNGKSLSVSITRDETDMQVDITPCICMADNNYRIGMWVRDSSAGIGTLTFYNPENNCFAGLGHPVCDVDTGCIMPLYKGEVAEVTVNSIKKGRAGIPGELVGSFSDGGASGTLISNCENGLYGVLSGFDFNEEPVVLGLRHEIETGKAYIYTTIDGKEPQRYDINIEKIDLHDSNNGKNMIIKVTDEELLEKTGGIVQGMSGSPIIQNGKLVGAITHVFVNDPSKGYAIFADTMYDSSEQVMKTE